MNYRRSVVALLAIVLGMAMLAYASVPLYRLFCKVTGYGGTTQRATTSYSGKVLPQTLVVRFNADTDPGLPWKFKTPTPHEVTVHIGENKLVAFHATNLTDQPTRGTATYNVTPFLAGKYFNKIQCFCFNEQHLGPHQEANLPVSFFIDPAIVDDPDLKGLTNITLSYTFFSYESKNTSK
ncbi:MAG: cytochrome c oxidase assembly protein [Rhodospirillales bacterium 12-54-5]|nr:MAG: cytochrome c oxidase assembly protein [Rhodospirillales bacterium 12-54-5]